jgi:hypothetical protein
VPVEQEFDVGTSKIKKAYLFRGWSSKVSGKKEVKGKRSSKKEKSYRKE